MTPPGLCHEIRFAAIDIPRNRVGMLSRDGEPRRRRPIRNSLRPVHRRPHFAELADFSPRSVCETRLFSVYSELRYGPKFEPVPSE